MNNYLLEKHQSKTIFMKYQINGVIMIIYKKKKMFIQNYKIKILY